MVTSLPRRVGTCLPSSVSEVTQVFSIIQKCAIETQPCTKLLAPVPCAELPAGHIPSRASLEPAAGGRGAPGLNTAPQDREYFASGFPDL